MMSKLSFAVAMGVLVTRIAGAGDVTPLSPQLQSFVQALQPDVQNLASDRQQVLAPLADYVATCLAEQREAHLVAICTANSRRSQLTQAWLHAAAIHHGLAGVHAYSAGTEATACNERTVAALKRAGFSVEQVEGGTNPVYALQVAAGGDALRMWSKTIDDPANPSADFAALMCCSNADQACPNVPGAKFRVPLLYDDPKASDGTPGEVAAYDARSRQIASEMLWVMQQVAERNL